MKMRHYIEGITLFQFTEEYKHIVNIMDMWGLMDEKMTWKKFSWGIRSYELVDDEVTHYFSADAGTEHFPSGMTPRYILHMPLTYISYRMQDAGKPIIIEWGRNNKRLLN